MLNVGFDNDINPNQVVGIVDYSLAGPKRLVKTALRDRPRSVLKLNKQRRVLSLVILEGDRYILSAIPRIQLSKRWTELFEIPVEKKAKYKKRDANTRNSEEKK